MARCNICEDTWSDRLIGKKCNNLLRTLMICGKCGIARERGEICACGFPNYSLRFVYCQGTIVADKEAPSSD